jgi:hypothetical protein
MSKPPDSIIKLDSETLSLCEFKSGGSKGFWLYDKTRGMNLSMRAETETEAFVEALHYYQERLKEVEGAYYSLKTRVDDFVSQFI